MILDDATRHDLTAAAKADLSRYSQAKRDIAFLRERIHQLRAQAEGGTQHIDLDRVEKVCKSPKNKVETTMCVIIDLEARYTQKQREAEHTMMEIVLRIEDWTQGISTRILAGYYLFNQRLDDIAKKESYSKSQIKRLFRKALIEYGCELSKKDDT